MGIARKIYVRFLQRGSKQDLPIEDSLKRKICQKIGLSEYCNDSLFQPLVDGI